jgi:hypothetical protein
MIIVGATLMHLEKSIICFEHNLRLETCLCTYHIFEHISLQVKNVNNWYNEN